MVFLLGWPAFGANPIPLVNQPLVPAAVSPGATQFTLTVNGTGFVNGAVVNWNGGSLTTTFVSGSQLSAIVPAADVASSGTATVSVTNPSPGGGRSNLVYFPVTISTTVVSLASSALLNITDACGLSEPTSLLGVGDFNDDGNLDLAVAYPDCTTSPPHMDRVAVMLGNGDGRTFTAAPTSFVFANILPAVAGDFNGDGQLDIGLAFADRSMSPPQGDFEVLLGNGDGTFRAQSPSLTGSTGSDSLVLGDFNGDGKIDVAAVNGCGNDPFCGSGGTVSILLGSGDGTFQPSVVYPVGVDPTAIATGDPNGDGKLDVVVTNRNCINACGQGSVSILLGNGDGTFQAQTTLSTAEAPISASVADFNGDGYLDIAVADYTGVSVFLGNGNGTFSSTANPVSLSQPARSMAAGDFNADGQLDLVISTVSTSGGNPTVSLLLGNGDGTFQAPVDFTSLGGAPTMAVGDFNSDGKFDLAMNTSPVSILVQSAVPAVTLSPTSLSFGSQTVGTTSPAKTLTLTNTGSQTLTFTTMNLSGSNSSDFQLASTGTCPVGSGTLDPGSNCVIALTFTPSSTGNRGASLSIWDDAHDSPQTVSLTGTGIAPTVNLSASSLTFQNQTVGVPSAAQVVTLTNGGSAALSISSVAISGDFAESNTCGASVAAGASCGISVTFTPTATGTRSGTLTISDNASNSPQEVSLSGTGTGPVVSLSPASLTFPAEIAGTAGSPQTVTLSNSGNTSLAISNITVNGDFSQTNNCASSVSAGANCAISLVFKPRAGGTRTGSLVISDNASNSPQTVTLSGTGQDFTIGLAPGSSGSASVSPGQAANYNLSLAAEGGLNQAVTLTCTGEPSESTCTVSPSTVTPGTSATNVTIKVTTTAPSLAVPRGPRSPLIPPAVPWLTLLALIGVSALWATFSRGKGWAARLVPLGAILFTLMILSSCGGGGSSPPASSPGTAVGNYTLTVTGTSGNLMHSTTLTLTVN